jgi:hypothetical protein
VLTDDGPPTVQRLLQDRTRAEIRPPRRARAAPAGAPPS